MDRSSGFRDFQASVCRLAPDVFAFDRQSGFDMRECGWIISRPFAWAVEVILDHGARAAVRVCHYRDGDFEVPGPWMPGQTSDSVLSLVRMVAREGVA